MPMSDTMIESATVDTEIHCNWLSGFPAVCIPEKLLMGSCQSPEYPVWPREHDNFHYPLGMGRLLELGFSGITSEAKLRQQGCTGNRRHYLQLIERIYGAAVDCVKRHADAARTAGRWKMAEICDAICVGAPESFEQACQLYWFAVLFRIGTATIGRIDQHLYPFYFRDIQRGGLSESQARSLVFEMLWRFDERGAGHGDTLQNIMLGGADVKGNDQTNELTYLILESHCDSTFIEPKINVRLHPGAPDRLLSLVAQMQLKGTGNCTVFNDPAIISGLLGAGYPPEVAHSYCNDGCSEIILDGYGETSFRYIDCVKAVEHVVFNGQENNPKTLRMPYYDKHLDPVDVKPPVATGMASGDFAEMTSFSEVFESYLKQLQFQVSTVLSEPYVRDAAPMRVFTAATMPDVLESGIDPYHNPSCYHSYGLFMGSLATAANSLAAIRHLIFETHKVTAKELRQALADDFVGHELIRQWCLQAPKFGNDDNQVDQLAVNLAAHFAAMVQAQKGPLGRSILSGLYNHLFHHTAYYVGATPDGRRFGDAVGEHLSPTPGTAQKGPTAVINSVAKINTSAHIFGSTLHLNIPAASLGPTNEALIILKALNTVFCDRGACVLNTNILDIKCLREAQKYPDKYSDLVVRVWGFSFYFTRLSPELQEHVIARAQG